MDHPLSRVAVIVPALNEELTIGLVIDEAKRLLPEAAVIVADNGSTDATARVAADHGAQVLAVPKRGKGIAVRALLANVDADCYVMVDGDLTYDISNVRQMVDAVLKGGIDMAVGNRIEDLREDRSAYPSAHRAGNRLFTELFRLLFGLDIQDTFSGYRVLSRRLAKSFPTRARGFEIEAELNIYAAQLELPIQEFATPYTARPLGSTSKLNTWRDGLRILVFQARLFRVARPLLAFTILAIPWLLASVALLIYVFSFYFSTRTVPNMPSLVSAVGCFIVALNLVSVGMVLQTVAQVRIEMLRLAYLSTSRSRP